MKVGLFFGSFNPIHIGHLVIAGYMAEFTDLGKVWFVVSPHNPLKAKNSLLADHHRLEMVKMAIEDHPKLVVSDIEFKLPQPSYTVDTLAYLKEKYPKHTFSLIMGSDALTTLPKWKNYEYLLAHYSMYIYPRLQDQKEMYKNQKGIIRVNAPVLEISASFIRNAIKQGKDIRYMLPEKVNQYIQEMHFYRK